MRTTSTQQQVAPLQHYFLVVVAYFHVFQLRGAVGAGRHALIDRHDQPSISVRRRLCSMLSSSSTSLYMRCPVECRSATGTPTCPVPSRLIPPMIDVLIARLLHPKNETSKYRVENATTSSKNDGGVSGHQAPVAMLTVPPPPLLER